MIVILYLRPSHNLFRIQSFLLKPNLWHNMLDSKERKAQINDIFQDKKSIKRLILAYLKKLILKIDENIQFFLSQNGLQLFLVFETVKTEEHKGSLNSEGILTLVPLTKKRCQKRGQISSLSRKFEFPTLFSKQLIQLFCLGARFGTYSGNGTKIKIPSEIKPPLTINMQL